MDINQSLNAVRETIKIERRKQRHLDNTVKQEKSQQESDRIENNYFDLLKNLTVLSGSVFASSIALASGKSVSLIFFIGELFLLLSTITGIGFLWSQLQGEQTFHWLFNKFDLEGELISYEDLMEPWEKDAIKKQIAEYQRLGEKKGVFYHFLKVVKIDWFPAIFFFSFIIGLVLILLSLLHANRNDVIERPLTQSYRINEDSKLRKMISTP